MIRSNMPALKWGAFESIEHASLLPLLTTSANALKQSGRGVLSELNRQLETALNVLQTPFYVSSNSFFESLQSASQESPSLNSVGVQESQNSDRPETLISIGNSNIALRVMIYGERVSELRPLVILNSIEYAMPPSASFCEQMWANGYQVIFIERPGFGASSPLPSVLFADELISGGATATTEAVILQNLLEQLELKQVILLGMGSANPVCYRLSLMSDIVALAIFSNVVFNKDILDVFRPRWLQQMFRQTVHSKSGLKIALAGIKHRMRKKPLEFYRLLMHQSPGDVAYLDAHPSDFVAAGKRFQSMDHSLMDYDLRMSLKPDALLKDGLFAGCNAIAFSGTETPDHWRTQLDSEAERLDIPVAYAPHGDFLAPYASSDYFLSVLKDNAEAKSSAAL